ncbi:MAG TPA: acetate kinase [Candidatus Kapabacteria bacterium]|nr:acetate kinase [Candidatus Kapabacteria bacterium]
MNILVINCGSSSLKFQIIETNNELIDKYTDKCLVKGLIERIGSLALITITPNNAEPFKTSESIRDHKTAINYIINWISSEESKVPGINSINDIHAIGHRTVHGGEVFHQSVKINSEVIKALEDNIDLAPLHNPANIRGIRAATEVFGTTIPQVAVFDTSFHQTMPEENYLYAIPYQYYRRYKIRKYGFHGTSHRFVSYRYRKMAHVDKESTNIITVHLGNGASICAIKQGKSVATSMGFTPLEGLIMGTRSGDIDPSIIEFLAHKEQSNLDEIFNMLNKRSGLLGISGLTHDMRDLLEEEKEFQDRRAVLAIKMYSNKIKQYIGAYMTQLEKCDAICFTGGIGENAAEIRRRVCENLEWLGISLDKDKNLNIVGGKEGIISSDNSAIKLFVIPTNEELIIARDTFRIVNNTPLPQ